MNRRDFLTATLSVAAVGLSAQQQPPATINPEPAPRDWTGQTPVRYPDPDLVAIDTRFRRYIVSSAIHRLYTGTQWAEGPAWNGVGKYLVWSDAPNNVQMRFIDEESRVTVFRSNSGNSNGNTFDYEGRQLSCEHGNRRVVRYEQNGTITVIADKFNGHKLNSPNDIVVHPDGGIWFTDPIYGIRGNYEGNKSESETKPAVYRFDPKSGVLTLITDEMNGPNGLCFSPDFKILYVADTGTGREIRAYDVEGARVRNSRRHVQLAIPGSAPGSAGADGMRCDTDGNLWAGARPGVQIIAPDGVVIGMIRLPENCANVCFGGVKRNRLFMTASQSLYAVYVETQGAAIA